MRVAAARAAARRRSARRPGPTTSRVRLDRLVERARDAAAARRRARGARRRAGRRSTPRATAPARSWRCRCRARRRRGPTVMNGGLCSAVVSAANAGSSVEPSDARRRRRRARRRRGVARAPAARQRVVVERERAVFAAEQLVDEALHLAVAEARIGALHQRDVMRHLSRAPRSCGTRAPVPAHVVHAHDAAALHRRRTRPRRATPRAGRRSRGRAARR